MDVSVLSFNPTHHIQCLLALTARFLVEEVVDANRIRIILRDECVEFIGDSLNLLIIIEVDVLPRLAINHLVVGC